jgi:hypothetical protein
MSLVITSTKADGSMAFEFKNFDSHNLAPNADKIINEGGDPYTPNPDHIKGAGFDLSEGSFMQLLGELGLDRHERALDITMLRDACDEYLTLKVSIEKDDWFGQMAMKLHAVAEAGISKGATQVEALSG